MSGLYLDANFLKGGEMDDLFHLDLNSRWKLTAFLESLFNCRQESLVIVITGGIKSKIIVAENGKLLNLQFQGGSKRNGIIKAIADALPAK